MAVLVVLATVVVLSHLADAGIDPLDEAIDTAFDFEATLKAVYKCEGTNYDNYWENCSYSRVTPDKVLLSMDIVVGKEIPKDPTYLMEVVIENQPNENAQEKVLVAALTATDICKELENEENKPIQDFLEKIDGDMTCPVEKGIYKAQGVEMNIEKVKPMLREGLMYFSITQLIKSEPISCQVAEFIITIE